ncbi:MAG TPA: hypothetical protein VMW94_09280 [Actinomycetes bacterium]|nr:hypothetical protein [Actinomycetes bacterium]
MTFKHGDTVELEGHGVFEAMICDTKTCEGSVFLVEAGTFDNLDWAWCPLCKARVTCALRDEREDEP